MIQSRQRQICGWLSRTSAPNPSQSLYRQTSIQCRPRAARRSGCGLSRAGRSIPHLFKGVCRIVGHEMPASGCRVGGRPIAEVHAPQQDGLLPPSGPFQPLVMPLVLGEQTKASIGLRTHVGSRGTGSGGRTGLGGRPVAGPILRESFQPGPWPPDRSSRSRGNLLGSQRLAFGGHFLDPLGAGHGVDQQTFVALAENGRRAAASPLDRQARPCRARRSFFCLEGPCRHA